MRAKSGVLLMLALGCGTFAALGVSQLMARKGEATSTQETAEILVAVQDVSYGAPLTAEFVKLEAWPRDKVPQGALTEFEEIEGMRTKTKLYQGEPILRPKLLSEDEAGSPALSIPKGFRVVAVKVSAQTAGGSLILPQDRVDVVLFLKKSTSNGIADTLVRTILQDVRVFAVNQTHNAESEGTDGQAIAAKTVSLLVSPTQAEKLALAEELGSIRLTIRSPDDDSEADVPGAELADVLNDVDSSGRKDEDGLEDGQSMSALEAFLASQAQNSSQEPTFLAGVEPQGWSMTLVRGHVLEEVQFNAAGDPVSQQSGGDFGAGQLPSDMTTVPSLDTPPMQDPDMPQTPNFDLSTLLNGLL